MRVTGQITAETIVNWISHLARLTIERDELAAERDRYKEAFAMLVNELGDYIVDLRGGRDWGREAAANQLEAAIDDIMREEGIDDDE